MTSDPSHGYVTAPVAPPQQAVQSAAQVRPVRFLGYFVMALLGMRVALELTDLPLSLWWIASYRAAGEAATQEMLAVDYAMLVSGGVDVALLVATGVLFLVWLNRARRNVEAYPVRNLRRGRVAAIVSWFVPVIALWWPKQSVDDVWNASRADTEHGADVRLMPRPRLVWGWWIALLSWVIVERTAWLVLRGADPEVVSADRYIETNTLAAGLAMIASSAGAAAALLAIFIVHRISDMQERRNRHVLGIPA